MKENLEKFKSVFKKIFFISVLVLVIIEFRRIGKEVKVEDVKAVFSTLSFTGIFLMILYGILANVPATLYDFVLNKELGNEIDKRYIAETGFTINNFNDLLGFGGIISIGLRTAFYGKDHEPKALVAKIVQLLMFLPCGLGFFSILSLISLQAFPNKPGENYQILLILASAYPIGIIILSLLKKINIESKNKVKLFFISIAEWFGVMSSFVVVGLLMGIKFDIINLSVFVVIANIVGYISMIPGSIGSFDLIVLFALSSQGIDRETALAWILLYRLSYYVVPFCLASFFFVKNFAKAFKLKDDKFVRGLVGNILVVVNSVMMYIFGIFMILSVTFISNVYGSGFLAKINPVRASVIFQFPSILFGFTFILMARATISRQKKSKVLNVTVLLMSLIFTFFTGYGLITIIYILIMLALVILTRKDMDTKQFLYAFEDKFVDFLLVNSMLLIFIIRFLRTGTVIDLTKKYISDFIFVPFEYSIFSIMVNIGIVYLIIFLLMKYLQGSKIKIGESFDRERFLKMCQSQGGSKEAYLALLRDKDLYYYREEGEDKAALQIKTIKDKIIVMGDPIGDEDFFDDLLDQFINEADDYGYNIAFYEISKKITMKLHNYGFRFMKFGESAEVDLQAFNLDGKKNKSLRRHLSRMEKEGYSFEVLEKPHSGETIQRLREISDSWLGESREKGFSIGFFDYYYLDESDIAVVRDKDSKIIAFANLAPTFLDDWRTVDLMRYERGVDNLMDFLFINIFNYFKERGVKYFDLGMAPLSNVGSARHSFLQEKFVYMIFKLGDNFYSFEGLKAYKNKYASFWDERYLAYSKGSYLIFAANTIFCAINSK
ncbi:MAG: bifunctional lysylphosphatidylglycerol flippase/synthetase MprF [Finegoldia sp.]|nr:bifunctional lysylphosphatidylglycerol flippase/synthetase MprF [Finegoldia sp.]